MLLGSEGILGVITEAWVRVQPKPAFRAGRSVRFGDFMAGAEAVRALSQSGLHPANCRLVDAAEAQQSGAGDGRSALLVLGFESTDHDVDARLERGLALCREHGGEPDPPRSGAASSWKDAFIALPYLRDAMVQWGVLCETFETAITWERWPAFHAAVLGATREAVGEPCRVTCRFTHVYPDGPAPYYTVLAPGRGAGRSSSSGTRSRPPRARPSSTRAARSPTTTRSAATTARSTTSSARTSSPRPCAGRRPPSIRAA
jgi:alkyldihydroxyacetonephosphate synthase